MLRLARRPIVRRALLLAGLVLVPGGHAASLGGTPVVFVAVEGDSTVVAVNVASGHVIARTRVAAGPHNIAVAQSGIRPLVLVTSPAAGTLTAISGKTQRVPATLRGLGYPHDVEVAHDGRWAYVTDERRNQVVVVRLPSLRVVRRIAVPPRPHDLAVSPVGRDVWVTHGRRRNITVLATARPSQPRVVGSVRARGAHDIAYSPDGLTVWLTYWDSGRVGLIDASHRTPRFVRDVGTLVHHVSPGAVEDTAWATDHGSGATYLVSGRSGRVRRTYVGCPGAHHAAPAPPAVVVACHDADAIAIYDHTTRRRLLVGVGDRPHGVAIAILP